MGKLRRRRDDLILPYFSERKQRRGLSGVKSTMRGDDFRGRRFLRLEPHPTDGMLIELNHLSGNDFFVPERCF